MADFVQKTVNKSAVRDLSVPIANVTAFNNLVQSVIADNPFGCVGYTPSEGEYIEPGFHARNLSFKSINPFPARTTPVNTPATHS